MGVSSHLHFNRTPHAATVAGGDGGCTHSDVCVMMGLRVRQAATNQGTCVEASCLLYPALRWCQVSSQEKVSETELCRPEGQVVHSQESRMGQGEELHCPLSVSHWELRTCRVVWPWVFVPMHCPLPGVGYPWGGGVTLVINPIRQGNLQKAAWSVAFGHQHPQQCEEGVTQGWRGHVDRAP